MYETRDHIGKLIEQPCLTKDEAEGQVRLICPSAVSSHTARGISNAPKNFPSDGAFSDQDSTVQSIFFSEICSDFQLHFYFVSFIPKISLNFSISNQVA